MKWGNSRSVGQRITVGLLCLVMVLSLSGCSLLRRDGVRLLKHSFHQIVMLTSNLGIRSTDLSQITVDGIHMGDKWESIDFSEYAFSDRYTAPEEEYTLVTDEMMLAGEEGRVTFLFARIDEMGERAQFNGHTIINRRDAVRVLGTSFQDRLYDREQWLREMRYIDRIHGIQLSLVYACNGPRMKEGRVLWIEMVDLHPVKL